MVEQRTENPCVGSSTLPLGTFTQQLKTSGHIGCWFFVSKLAPLRDRLQLRWIDQWFIICMVYKRYCPVFME